MGKKGDIGDWEEQAKKWLELIYKLIEKPEKKEFEQTLELVLKTRKLLQEMEYPIHQALADDLRMQLAAVVNAAKYVLENVPKGNYYMVMPDFITHMSRVVLLISKVIQNIWCQKHGVYFEYVPPEASVYIPAQEGFFRPEMKGREARIPTRPAQPAPAPAPAGPRPQTGLKMAGPVATAGYTYNPYAIYSRAYKYAYWRPRSREGSKLYLAGLLAFLPMFLRYLREKSRRGGLSPSDVNLTRTIFQRIKEVSSRVNLEGVNLEPLKQLSDKVLESVRGVDFDEIQRRIAPIIEQAEQTLAPLAESSKEWLSENVPKLVDTVRSAVQSGALSQVDLQDIQSAVKNVSMLVGDQVKDLPKLAEQATQQLSEVARQAAPVVEEVARTVAREAGEVMRNFPTMIGSMGKALESVDFSQLTESMQDVVEGTEELIESAAEGFQKLLKSFFG